MSANHTYRVEVEYRVRRVVYVAAENRDDAKEFARNTTEWLDANTPHEMVGEGDRIVVRSVRVDD